MKKRLVALLMAMAMCFAMFGCGSADTEEPAADEEPVAEEPATDEATDEATTDEATDDEAAPEADTEAQPE